MSRVRSVWAWGPSTSPTACALAGRRCSLWGWRKGVPGGGAFHHCEGHLRSGAVPPPTARPLGGLLGSATHCCGRGRVGVGAQRCPLGVHALWGLRAVGVVGGRPRGGWPATVVRGVWCQALSLLRPLALWGGRPGFRDPCVPGPVGAGLGPSTGPTACALAGRRCSLWGWWKGVPRGVPSTVVRGVWCQALSLPGLPAHWAGCWGPPPTCCGRGCVGVGAQHCPLGLHALWGLRAAGVAGGPSPGGVACHSCEGRLVSGAVPPPAARPLERAARVPQPVCPGCGRCGRGDPAPAPQRAPLRAGVARCGGGGRAFPGGVSSTIVRGI